MIRHNTEFHRRSPLRRGLEALRRIARGWQELLPGQYQGVPVPVRVPLPVRRTVPRQRR